MRHNNFIKNIVRVTLSNGFRLLASILMGLVLPIIFSVENYGYYRLFALYLTYFGLFHLGFIDGVYLHFGGKNYEDLNKAKFVSYSRFLFYLESIAAIVIISVSLIFLEGERKLIFICLGINVIASNLTSYYQFISQVTSRFKEFSFRNIMYAILTSFSIGLVFVFRLDSYKIFLLMIIIINYLLLIWYIYTYRKITFGKKENFKNTKSDIIYFFKLGFPLLLANLITVFMLNLSKQIVDFFFDIETFAIFSFAFSMMSLANIFVTAMSTVVYPTLKKIEESKLKNIYGNSISFVIVVILYSLILYYPLDVFVNLVVDKYSESLIILRIVFPSLVISSAIQIVKLNYFKVFQHIKQYLITGLIALVFTALISFGSYYFFETIESIAIASVISIFGWYILTDIYFYKTYKVNILKNLLFLVLGISVFYVSFLFNNLLVSFLFFILILTLLTIIFFKSYIYKVFKSKSLFVN